MKHLPSQTQKLQPGSSMVEVYKGSRHREITLITFKRRGFGPGASVYGPEIIQLDSRLPSARVEAQSSA